MNTTDHDLDQRATSKPLHRLGALGQLIGHSRFIVIAPVTAVLLVSISMFLLGTVEAVTSIWRAWATLFNNHNEAPDLSASFVKTVTIMLEAVVFFWSELDCTACSSLP